MTDKFNAMLEQVRTGHTQALDGFFRDCSPTIIGLADACATAISNGNKLLFCGNGGSACDAMHIAGEFVGRFIKDRPALPAIALTADSGVITCLANDYDYTTIFSRQIEALGQPGDVLIALSTSGRSPNVLAALKVAKERGLKTALWTGEKNKSDLPSADFTLIVPSVTTAHIQEAHMVALHGMTGLIEAKLFPSL